jgi:hypothetical protein
MQGGGGAPTEEMAPPEPDMPEGMPGQPSLPEGADQQTAQAYEQLQNIGGN